MHNQNYSFVVRIWLESTDDNAATFPVWRGSIEEVDSDHRIYFSDLKEITQFIERQINQDGPSSSFGSRMSLKYIHDSIRSLWNRLFH